MLVLEKQRLLQRASPGRNEKELSLGKKGVKKGEMMADARVCPYQPGCSSYFSLDWSLESGIPAWPQLGGTGNPDPHEIKAALRQNILCKCCRSGMCHALHSGHFLENIFTIRG